MVLFMPVGNFGVSHAHTFKAIINIRETVSIPSCPR